MDKASAILQEIQKQSETIQEQSERLTTIEKAMTQLARQDEKILNLQGQIHILWKKYDEAFNLKDGAVTAIQMWQQSCPRDSITKGENRQWWAIGILTVLYAGALLKSLGVFDHV